MEDDELRALLRAATDQLASQADQIAQLASLTRTNFPTHKVVSPLTAPSPSVSEIYQRYSVAKAGAKSWRIARGRLRAFLAVFGLMPTMSLTIAMWAAYRERRKTDDPIAGKAIAPSTINFELDWAKAMFNWASQEEQGLIPANPLTRAKREKVDNERETWLTEEDVQKLISVCKPWVAAFILVAVDTGLRKSEVLMLRRDRLRIVETEGGERIAIAEFSKRRTKAKRAHQVAITPRALAAIEALPPTVNPYVFASPYKPGKPYNPRHINTVFREACERTEIDVRAAEGDGRIRVHDLRHTAATAAGRRGASLRKIQRMLNHSSSRITERYVHQDEDDVISLARLMEHGAANERKPPKRAPASPTGEGAKFEKK